VLFATPQLSKPLLRELGELDALREKLGDRAGAAGPWLGSLRRQVRASAAESSIEIEGFRVPEEETVALASGDQTPDPSDDDRMALSCYGRAMDHVGVMAVDPAFRWLDRVILDLHFDACYFQKDKDPGRYRRRGIEVTAPRGGPPAYVAPPHERVPELMDEIVDWLDGGDVDAHVAVRAAMAHLHVVSVHPFRDGNGRISRIVQSLVLARDGLLSPELGSIEEYLRRNTDDYYAALKKAQGGSYRPDRDAIGWVRFCIGAHLEQARARLAQMDEAGARWALLEEIVERHGWPDRIVIALEQTLFGTAERAAYTEEADVSPATASADFRRLVDAGLVVQRGKGRSTRYVAGETLRDDVARALGARGGSVSRRSA
jgi:Fic family protein